MIRKKIKLEPALTCKRTRVSSEKKINLPQSFSED